VGSFHPLVVLLVNRSMPLVGVFLGCYGMGRGLGCVSLLPCFSSYPPPCLSLHDSRIGSRGIKAEE
jgi:hypothetical protein